MYTINTTTARPTIQGTLENCTATLARMNFDTYEGACAVARQYAAAYGALYIKPGAEVPTLKEGQTYVEVVAA